MLITGVIAIITAYLIGSVSGAYIVTRIATGNDIRKLGSGNAGARNVYRSVGPSAGVAAVVIDAGKGAAAVAVADLALGAVQPLLALAGLAAVAGHIWPAYLKFRGGNGLSTCMGVLLMMLTREAMIIVGIMLVIAVLTRNPILGLTVGLLSLPVSAWFLEKSLLAVLFSLALITMMALHFLPTARAALGQAGGNKQILASLLGAEPEKAKPGKAKGRR
jgi:acyl phosphate:glycerol-3-phosphate acyltransferase